MDQLQTTRTRPVCLDLLNNTAARSVAGQAGINLPEAAWVIVVGFEDNGDAVRWQVRQLLHKIAPSDIQGVEARAGDASQALWRTLAEFTLSGGRLLSLSPLVGEALTPHPYPPPQGGRAKEKPPPQGGREITFKANMLPQAVASFCPLAATFPEIVHLHAHAGSGIVRGHLGGDLTVERVAAMLKVLTDAATAAEGNLVLPHCPVMWKRDLPVWGQERGDLWLMRQVKKQMDPRNLFNPGRFVGSI